MTPPLKISLFRQRLARVDASHNAFRSFAMICMRGASPGLRKDEVCMRSVKKKRLECFGCEYSGYDGIACMAPWRIGIFIPCRLLGRFFFFAFFLRQYAERNAQMFRGIYLQRAFLLRNINRLGGLKFCIIVRRNW